MKRIIIYTKEEGIFLGECLGFGFWSKLDPVGQDSAVTFPDIETAKSYVKSWKNQLSGIQFKEIKITDTNQHTGEFYASIKDCINAGLPGWNPV